MDAMAAYSSASDDDGDDDSERGKKEKKEASSHKRPRLESGDGTLDSKLLLPLPSLSSESMRSWSVDYLTRKQQEKLSSAEQPSSSNRLDHVASLMVPTSDDGAQQNEGSSVGWAAYLQKQKEFHNPHFFESVVEHFHIEPMGSNLQVAATASYDDECETMTLLVQREYAARSQAF